VNQLNWYWIVLALIVPPIVGGLVALFQVIALFSLSLKVDERARRRGYAPEWR